MALTWHQGDLVIQQPVGARIGSTAEWGVEDLGAVYPGAFYLVIPKLNLERDAAVSVIFGTTWRSLFGGAVIWLGGRLEFSPLQIGRFELYASGDPSVTDLAGVCSEGSNLPDFLSMVRATSILVKEPR